MPDERIEVELVGKDTLAPMLEQAEKNVQRFKRNVAASQDPNSSRYDISADYAAFEEQYMVGVQAQKQRQALLDQAKVIRQKQREERDIALAMGVEKPGAGFSRTGLSSAYQGRRGIYEIFSKLGLGQEGTMGLTSLALDTGVGRQAIGPVAMMNDISNVAGALLTKIPRAAIVVGGLTAGLAALGVAAASAAWGLGETALKADTLALKGAGAKTSIEQLAEARQRISLGVGRNFSGGVDFVNTQLGAVAATAAQAVGNQRPDERVANAEAIQRAADQRLALARQWYGNAPEPTRAPLSALDTASAPQKPGGDTPLARVIDAIRDPNSGLGRGMRMSVAGSMAATVYGSLPGTTAGAEQAAEQARAEVVREQFARSLKAQAQLVGAGGPPSMTGQENADYVTARFREQQRYVASLKQEMVSYNEQLKRMNELGKQFASGDTSVADEMSRLNQSLKQVDAKRLMDVLADAETQLKDLTEREWVVRISAELRGKPMRAYTEDMSDGIASLANPSTDFAAWLRSKEQTEAFPNEPSVTAEFDMTSAPMPDRLAYMRYITATTNATRRAGVQMELDKPMTPYRAPQRDTALEKLEGRLQGLIGQGPSTAVGLGDLRGGTYGGGPMAPGAGGPFEALFRIQDIAMNADKPGQDTRKWQEMYGLDKEQAKGISKQFQMGVFSPDVMKYVDTQALVDTSAMMDLADKSQEALAKELAKKGANPANIKRLLGLSGKDDKDTGQYKPAIDAMVGGMNAELTNKASAVEDVGKKFWDGILKGLTSGAKESDALLNVIRQLIREQLGGNAPPEK